MKLKANVAIVHGKQQTAQPGEVFEIDEAGAEYLLKHDYASVVEADTTKVVVETKTEPKKADKKADKKAEDKAEDKADKKAEDKADDGL